jgi:hypothetical protein
MVYGRLNTESAKFVTHYVFGAPRNIMVGAGLAYAVQNELYLHLPLIFLTPSIYVGYHLYNNKERVIQWIREHGGSMRLK